MSDCLSVRVYESNDRFFVHNISDNFLISILRNNPEMRRESINSLNNVNINKVYKSFGILGMINLNISDFLISVSEAKKVGAVGNTDIYQIHNVNFIQIDKISDNHFHYNTEYIHTEINLLIAGMKKIISEGVYFSRNFDLTNSLQNQKNIKVNNNQNYDILRNANQKYLFNEPNLRPFFQSEIFSSSILINSIYGYVNSIYDNINGMDINYVLMSRKDIGNLKLNVFSLGIDEIGNISNTVETEQILIIGANVFSYVQIRSPPLISSSFMNDINNPNFQECDKENFDMKKNYSFFKYHLNELNENFRFIYILNFLNKDNQQEGLTNNILETHIKNSDNKNFKYNYFNFDVNCLKPNRNNNNLCESEVNKHRDPLEHFLSGIQNVLNIFKFFGVTFDSIGNKNLSDQVGIIREICVDGLERSNVIQMRISWLILEMQLKSIKIIPFDFFGGDIISVKQFEINGLNNQEFLNNPKKKGIEFIIRLKKLWKENSQILSYLYNGGIGQNDKQTICNFSCNRHNDNDSLINNMNNPQIYNFKQVDLHLKSMDEYLRQNCIDVLTCRNQVKRNNGIFIYKRYIIYNFL